MPAPCPLLLLTNMLSWAIRVVLELVMVGARVVVEVPVPDHTLISPCRVLRSLAMVLAGLLIARAAVIEMRKRGSGRPNTPPKAATRTPVSIAKYSRCEARLPSSPIVALP